MLQIDYILEKAEASVRQYRKLDTLYEYHIASYIDTDDGYIYITKSNGVTKNIFVEYYKISHLIEAYKASDWSPDMELNEYIIMCLVFRILGEMSHQGGVVVHES